MLKCVTKNLNIFQTHIMYSASMHAIIIICISLYPTQNLQSKMVLTNLLEYILFLFMDDYVTKFEKHPCMVLSLVDFQAKTP